LQQRAAKCFTLLLYGAATVGGIWLAVRFLLPWAAPFIVAFALAALFEPAVSSMVRHGWRRSVAAGSLSLALLGLTSFALVQLTSRGMAAVSRFARQAPQLVSSLGAGLERLKHSARAYILSAPQPLSGYLSSALESVLDTLYSLPGNISQWLLDAAGKAAQNSPGILLFAVTAGIGTYFISASFPRTLAFIEAQLPKSFIRRLEGLGSNLKSSFGGFVRAQLILMAMTFFELFVAFMLLRVKRAAALAIITALVDALPVFGTGLVLVPWAIYALILGDVGRGAGLIISWAAVTLVRSCVQAKLLGDHIGLDPLVSLVCIYVGWQVWGVWGMLLFPIVFVTVQQLNDKGVIKLWKSI